MVGLVGETARATSELAEGKNLPQDAAKTIVLSISADLYATRRPKSGDARLRSGEDFLSSFSMRCKASCV
jgi:hypothetical protein